ncbi:MXAN_6652 family MXYO-CTERM-anchored protein [Vitiosangium sp. GDMCC 1.1324]|uniref:MXAN_6652 family MXYO-CTERM-anchored protein n=1 Tax=Vitiosangium sp. (strain GDMCC 1.1324) TaxID=2138576 RepID=UPI000D3B9BF8|nr:MXAN_6652 family MXYO-CTERM-anchored protein [Vitiosangium sp. GDMCC 1.1324]PTL81934.1 hypothetical protein DAT35_19130 [Vitiosangium sp. GDMCC 1.1324]
MRFQSYGVAGVLTACLMSVPALANSTGITGYSGKTAQTCTTCHSGGAAPTVEISGPDSLQAGATGNYTLIIRGGAGVKGGFDVAVDNTAATLAAGTGSKLQSGELTHTAPKPASGGEIRFDFSLVAPQSAGSVKIFGAGNSVNGDGAVTLDNSATTSKTVTITAAPEEDTGGCSATGGAPVMLFSLLAGTMTLLRRRRA